MINANVKIMKTRLLLAVLLAFVIMNVNAQTDYLIINDDIRLPEDSIVSVNLVNSLNGFLYSVKEDKDVDSWLVPDEKIETQILTSEIQILLENDTIEINPYLIDVEELSDKKSYSVRIAYISQNDLQSPLKAIFEFITYEKEKKYLFASPLLRNTKEWKTKTDGYLVFHYQSIIAENISDQYIKITADYDKKLGINKMTEYYFCDDCKGLADLLHLAGIQYKVDYNGLSWPMTEFYVENKAIALYGREMSRKEFVDPHDVFHARASFAIPSNVRNHYMICGAAYVYGGSWGISWIDIQNMFKERMVYDKKTDWLKLYFDRYNFGKSQEEHLLVTQFINALLIEKIEKEHGFSAVMKLLSSGNMYRDKENFFKILEDVTGVNEANFNSKIRKIIDDSLNNVY